MQRRAKKKAQNKLFPLDHADKPCNEIKKTADHLMGGFCLLGYPPISGHYRVMEPVPALFHLGYC